MNYNRPHNKIGEYDSKYYGSSIYKIWSNMKARCSNKNSSSYKNYGARGITVSKDWIGFEKFLEDMLPTYKKGLTLERIDNNKGYSKENCIWATRLVQAQNTRNIERAIKFSLNGKMYTISELAKMFNIKRRTLGMRLVDYHWSLERALNL